MTEAEPQTTYRLLHALNLCLFVRQPLAGQPIRLGTVLYCDGMRFANNFLDFLMPNHVPILESVIRCGLSQIGESATRVTMSRRVTVRSLTVPFMIQTVEAVCIYIQASRIVCHLSFVHTTHG